MENLTTKENLLATVHMKQASEYDTPKLLTNKEQAALDIFASMNDYIKVASTIDGPITDETNVLYKVDGVDVDDLFAVLSIHKRCNRTLDTKKEEDVTYMDKNDKSKYTTYINKVGNIEETRSQTVFGNTLLSAVDLKGVSDETLEDIVGGKAKFNTMMENQKLKHLEDRILFNLEALRKDYRKYQMERETATGSAYIQIERDLKHTYNAIKFLEKTNEKLKTSLTCAHFKKGYQPAIDSLLERFVNWQQLQLEQGTEPWITREESLEKSKLTRLKQYGLNLYMN